MADMLKMNASSLSLTQAELKYLESLVEGGDRNGFYLAYYAMAASNDRNDSNGAIELALQAKISSFSDTVGGTAYYTNRILQEAFGERYNGIYKLSQDVAVSALRAIRDDLNSTSYVDPEDITQDGIVSKDGLFESARRAWIEASQRTHFPGNLLDAPIGNALTALGEWWTGVTNNGYQVSRIDLLNYLVGMQDPGSAAALLAGVYVATLRPSAGKTVGIYTGDQYDRVTLWDGSLSIVVDRNTNKVVAVEDVGLRLSQTWDEVIADALHFIVTTASPLGSAAFNSVLRSVFEPYGPDLDNWKLLTESTTHGIYDGDANTPDQENQFPEPDRAYRSAATGKNDILQGTDSFPVINTGGNDAIDGLAGHDLIYGGGGEDTIDGGADNDIIWGQWGEDSLTGGAGDDVLRGGKGDDTFIGGQGSDTIDGGDIVSKRDEDGFDQLDYSQLGGKVSVHIRDTARNAAVFDGDLSELGNHSGVVDKGDGGAMGVDAFTSIETIAFGAFENMIRFGTSTIPNPVGGVLKLNFKLDGTTRPLTQKIELGHLNGGGANDRATDAIIGIDGKQLVGGAAFDFDKFDRTSSAISFFVDLINVPTSPPYVTGRFPDGISTLDRMQKWLGEHVTAHTDYLEGLRSAGLVNAPLYSGLLMTLFPSFMALSYADLIYLSQSIRSIYHQEIIGTQGERYTLSNASYDAAGRVTAADLTIALNPNMADAYTIKVDGWKQGDFGIRIENLKWGEGLETGTNKDGKADFWQDISLALVRQKLAGLGFQPREWDDGQRAAARNPDPTPKGISRAGTDAADAILGTSGDDVIDGQKGADTLTGGEGRDEYVFRVGDGADVVSDLSAEGSIVRFLGGLEPAVMQRSLVAGENGLQDLLITYGAGDTLRIVDWSSLAPEQQALWRFEGVNADISSPVSGDTPDISVLPDIGAGPTRITGTAAADTLDGGGGADRISALDGDDLLLGGAGRDTAIGGAGADTIVGGQGNDRLDGGRDGDTFRYLFGDGDDTLSDPDGETLFDIIDFDVLQLGEGLTAQSVRLVCDPGSPDDLILKIEGGGSIRILKQISEYGLNGIDEIRFADGTIWARSDFAQLYMDRAATDSADFIVGFQGPDTISGGAGADTLVGRSDSDTYLWSRGDGDDRVIDRDRDASIPAGTDRLLFGSGVGPGDVRATRGADNSDLILEISGVDGGSVTIEEFFASTNANLGVELIGFADGTVWTKAEISAAYIAALVLDGSKPVYGTAFGDTITGASAKDFINGGSGHDNLSGGAGDDTLIGDDITLSRDGDGDDTITGGGGNDYMDGGYGADTYVLGAGFGHDTISGTFFLNSDRIQFTAHTVSDFSFRLSDSYRSNNNGLELTIETVDQSASVRLNDFTGFGGPNDISFTFADGTVLSANDVLELASRSVDAPTAINGTVGADAVSGSDFAERFLTGAGADVVTAEGGGDAVYAGDGHDQVFGGGGGDVLFGEAGNDLLFGGGESDLAFGGSGEDLVDGGEGDDFLRGGAGSDTVTGAAGADDVSGDAGDDLIEGGTEADRLAGGDGEDTLTGGSGADSLVGGAGSDVYRFARGDGQDRIDVGGGRSVGDIETLELGDGLTALNTRFAVRYESPSISPDDPSPTYEGTGLNLVITFANGTSDEITVEDFLGRGALDRIVLSDGSVLGTSQILSTLTGASDANEVPLGILIPNMFNGRLIYGGRGNDTLNSSGSNDIYAFARGDGADTIKVTHKSPDNEVLLTGYQSSEAHFARGGTSNQDLIVTFTGTTDKLTFSNHYLSGTSTTSTTIDQIRFQDGIVLTSGTTIDNRVLADKASDGADSIVGGLSSETLVGGKGDDTLAGGQGNDVYLYRPGDGADMIVEAETGTDRLRLGEGITASSISVVREGTSDIRLGFADGGSVKLVDSSAGGGVGVDLVEFADGTVWTTTDLATRVLARSVTVGADTIVGTEAAETLGGGAGNDVMRGGGGSDTYLYAKGDGSDVIADTGSAGIDKLHFDKTVGAEDIGLSRDGANPQDLLITMADGQTIRVVGQFAANGIEQIAFADGTRLERQAIEQRVTATPATAGADRIVGTGAADTISGGAGNDQLSGGLGADVYRFAAGDGRDLIIDTKGANVLEFAAGVDASDVALVRRGDDLEISIVGTNDAVTVAGHFAEGAPALASIRFVDGGTVWTSAMIAATARPVLETQQVLEDQSLDIDVPAGVFAHLGSGLTLTATQADGAALPSWLHFDGQRFTGTPGNDATGFYAIKVVATNGAGASANSDFLLLVTPVNDAPVLAKSVDDLALNVYEAFSFNLPSGLFTDIDDTEISYTATLANGDALPNWLTFDPVTLTFSGEPDYNSVSDYEGVRAYEVRITARDDHEGASSTTFTIEVRAGRMGETISGTAGNDEFEGTSGSDTLIGGQGNDSIHGGGGSDVYVFKRGDGQDTYYNGNTISYEHNLNGVIKLGAGITAADISVDRIGSDTFDYLAGSYKTDLVLTIGSGSDRITVKGQFDESPYGPHVIREIHFADGTVWTAADVTARFTQATAGADTLAGDSLENAISGGEGDDKLLGLGGDDVLNGQGGDDDLFGGNGDDVYVFERGSGHDRAIETTSRYGQFDVDTLRFGAGITAADLVFERNLEDYRLSNSAEAGSVTLTLRDGSGSIVLYKQQMIENGVSSGVDYFEFADGTKLDLRQIAELMAGDRRIVGTEDSDVLVGTSVEETLTGGRGGDTLLGGEGDDVYRWSLGDGDDTIDESNIASFDVIEFGANVSAADVVLSRPTGDDLYFNTLDDFYIDILATGERITVDSGFRRDGQGKLIPTIDEIRFADGTVWTYAYMMKLVSAGTPGDDTLRVFDDSVPETLDGGAGDDHLTLESEDVVVFRKGYGHDTMNGQGTVRFEGDLTLDDIVVTRTCRSDYGEPLQTTTLILRDTGDSLSIAHDQGRPRDAIMDVAGFRFGGDGRTVTASAFADLYYASALTAGADTIVSFGDGRAIRSGAGADTIDTSDGDRLFGQDGGDTYRIWNHASGIVIDDDGASGTDTVEFAGDVKPSEVTYSRAANGRDLLIDSLSTDAIVVRGFFEATPKGIEQVRFLNGTVHARADILAAVRSAAVDSTVIVGTAGADNLAGGEGTPETLDGKAGADVLTGGAESGDLYLWRPGDGNDRIVEGLSFRSEAVDALKLIDVNAANAAMTRSGGDLVVTILSTGEQIVVQDQFSRGIASSYGSGIEEIVFNDAVWDQERFEAAASIVGGTGADVLYGSSDDDRFFGGTGHDTIRTDIGSDTFVYRSGDGSDFIDEESGSTTEIDTLALTNLNASDIQLSTVGNDVLVKVLSTGHVIEFDEQFYSSIANYGVERILFANGESWDRDRIAAEAWMRGTLGNDTLTGRSGLADTLAGGTGTDLLRGRSGSDTYYFAAGDGTDTIEETAESNGDIDRILFGSGVDKSTVTLTRATTGNNLVVAYGNGGSITVTGHFLAGGAGIEGIDFADGTRWTRNDLLLRTRPATSGADSLVGDPGDNTLSGGPGADTLSGGNGADTYLFGRGDGQDRINDGGSELAAVDTLVFDATIAPTDVAVSRQGNDIVLTLYGTTDSVRLENRLVSASGGVDLVKFADGTIWDYDAMLTLSADVPGGGILGTPGADMLAGTAGADSLQGFAGDDVLNGKAGADTLSGGAGSDTASYATAMAGLIVSLATPGSNSGEAAGDVFVGIENLQGSDFADALTGDAGANRLDGGLGADTLAGGGGNDVYVVDASGDVVSESVNAGTDEVRVSLAAYTLAANLEHLTSTGSAAFAGTGNALANRIGGGGGADTLNGGAGADTLVGGGGNDVYIVDSAADVVIEGASAGTDEVRASAAIFSLSGNVENLTYTGSGSFTGFGNALANALVGASGDDVLHGGAGADTLTGASGRDSASYASAAAGVTASLAAPTSNTGDAAGDVYASIEGLIGSAHADVLTGDGNANTLVGGTGNDTLVGGAGADTLAGGIGNDVYLVADAGDVMVEATSSGVDEIRTTLTTLTLSSNIERLVFTGSSAFVGTGNTLSNHMTGGAGDDILIGGAGRDTLVGGAGSDTASYATAGEAVSLSLFSTNQSATGHARGDQFESVENVIGTAFDDRIEGSFDANRLDGGMGEDTLSGRVGDDIYLVDVAADVVIEYANEGTDEVRASSASYTLGDHVEKLTFTGSGNFLGSGNTLANILGGGGGDDILIGGAGADTLNGGSGGIDTASYATATSSVRANLSTPSANSGHASGDAYTSIENLIGSNFNDTLTGDANGNLLNGGLGGDSLVGGAGDDIYVTDSASDVVSEASGAGTDEIRTTLVSVTLAANVEKLTYFGAAAFAGTGNALANTISGGAGNDTLTGGAGADMLSGAGGTDTAVLTGLWRDYAIGYDAATRTYTLSDRRSGTPDGIDVVTGVEVFRFSDRTITVTVPADLLNDAPTDILLTGGSVAENSAAGTVVGSVAATDPDAGDTATFSVVSGATDKFEIVGTQIRVKSGATLDFETARTHAIGIQVTDASGATFTKSVNISVTDVDESGIVGTSGADTLTGTSGADRIQGLDGDDVLIGAGGADTLDGGNGTDFASYAPASAGVVVSLASTGSNTGDAAGDVFVSIEGLIGSGFNDVLTGNANANTLNGSSGNDTLVGGAGTDTLIGGAGNDVFDVDVASDVVTEASSAGTDEVRTTLSSYTLGSNVENLTYTGSASFAGVGNSVANVLTGGSGNDTLTGGAGSDTLNGGSGTDTASYAGASAAVKAYLASVSSNTGDAAGDTYSSIENLTGSGFADTLTGDGNANLLDGGTGNDSMAGGAGNDIYVVESASDVVTEASGAGTDEVRTTLSSYTLGTNVENYVHTGSSSATGIGNTLANRLTGSSAANVLDGGAANDVLVGGAGADTFVFSTALSSNVDAISDFSVVDDTIRLSSSVFTGLSTGTLSSAAFVIGSAAADSSDRIIYNASTGALLFDRDGTGSTYTAVQFATVTPNLSMTNGDFLVS